MVMHANPVSTKRTEPSNIPPPGIPSQVRRSVLPDPEATRGRTLDKSQFRVIVEKTKSEVKVEPKVKAEERKVISRGEPVVKGTIVITIFENHPYEVEFSGKITGEERNLAWRAMMKQYNVWKAKVAKEQEKKIKAEEAKKIKEDEGNARD